MNEHNHQKIIIGSDQSIIVKADNGIIEIFVGCNVQATIFVVPQPNAHCSISVHAGNGSCVTLIQENSKNRDAQTISYRFFINERASLEYGLALESESENNFSIESHLNGVGATLAVIGFYLARKNTNLKLTVHTQHHAMRTQSTVQLYGVIYDQASVSYNGKTMVAENAQHVGADQQNRNLLLSEFARASSLPEMEVKAHQVQCSHGSALGKHDEAQLFYLQTRGICYDQAQYLLTEGFLFSSLCKASAQTTIMLKNRLSELL
ncbi:MAG TPA: SufD family Fe-S cluster assembly protein [Candidatus Babeliales bacterium]|nr:SufD family Fe-S cluster assembly protein [Candidatus Babeliales bacterium]